MKKIRELVIFLAIVSGISGGVLAFVNGLTEPIIEEQGIAKEKTNLELIFPGGAFEKILFTDDTGLVTEAYVAKDEGYIYKIESQGFKEKIVFMLGIDDAGTIVGYRVLNNQDTAGIGDKVEADSYVESIVGKTVLDSIDTISGATVSSAAIVNGIDSATAVFRGYSGDTSKPKLDDEKPAEPEADKYVATPINNEDGIVTYDVLVKSIMGDNRLEVVIDTSDLTVVSVAFTEEGDTADYVTKVNTEEYMNSFASKSLSEIEEIDVVSGATGTANSIKDAIALAVEAAGNGEVNAGEQEVDPYTASKVNEEDGIATYAITHKSFMGDNVYEVQVDVNNLTVVKILFTTAGDTPEYVEVVNTDEYLEQYVGKTLSDIESVDVVSGSTLTSNSVKEALKAVLEVAEGSE